MDNAQKLQPDSPETLLALGYYQRFVLDDWEAAKTTFRRVGEMLPSSSEVPMALGRIARNEGQWDDSNSYFERALSMDPRNVELLAHAAWNYTMLRQFPTALKLYDRALDLVPHDSELLASKAGIYQAQGNLKDAAKLLPEINEQTTSTEAFKVKITQMRLERRFDEAVHLLQTRLAQFRFFSAVEKSEYQAMLSFHLYLAGDRSSANFIAKQARDEIQSQLEGSLDWDNLALANAVMGNKDLAIKAAEHAVTLVPTVKDRVNGPSREEWLALIQTIVGENGRAISILTRLVQTPYLSWLYVRPVTPALLRLDPIWDPLRADPAFQKLCEEKQP